MKRILLFTLRSWVGKLLFKLLRLDISFVVNTRFGVASEKHINNNKQLASMMEEHMASKLLSVTRVTRHGKDGASVTLNGALEISGFTVTQKGGNFKISFPKHSNVKRGYIKKDIRLALIEAWKAFEQ